MEKIIHQIAQELISDEITTNDIDKLKLIASDSNYMMAFLSAVEEEFDIEFDDEMICNQFFSDYRYIVDCIQTLLSRK
jgi:acyl carrier protein